jgi:hypothetical protein
MRTLKLEAVLGVALALMPGAGCAEVSPARVTVDRMEYGEVIADSWKRQTLLNVVRMRYADAPVFLDVASVINSYSIGGTASANATMPVPTPGTSFGLGVQGTWSNTPTVTYQPLMGESFTRSLLQPIPPVSVFQLLQGGWPAATVMKSVVRSINGLRNDSFGVAGDAGFRELVDAMTRIQRAGGLGIRVEAREGGSGIVVVMRKEEDMSVGLRQDRRRVHELLGLDPGSSEFEIAYGLVPRSPNEVAVLSRSMLELLLELGYGLDLPPGHATNGRATPGLWQPGDVRAQHPLARIHSGKDAPTNAYAAVPYREYWYWIDDNDVASKRYFTFLMILFSLAETGPTAPGPVVTVPSR